LIESCPCRRRRKPRAPTDIDGTLYNERPNWLANAHRGLDEAVAAAYGVDPDIDDDTLLRRLLALNADRAGAALAEAL
jgi:hypothetical protein